MHLINRLQTHIIAIEHAILLHNRSRARIGHIAVTPGVNLTNQLFIDCLPYWSTTESPSPRRTRRCHSVHPPLFPNVHSYSHSDIDLMNSVFYVVHVDATVRLDPGMEMRMLWTYWNLLFSIISWLLMGWTDLHPSCAMITYPVGFYPSLNNFNPTVLSFSATARVTASFSGLTAFHMYFASILHTLWIHLPNQGYFSNAFFSEITSIPSS